MLLTLLRLSYLHGAVWNIARTELFARLWQTLHSVLGSLRVTTPVIIQRMTSPHFKDKVDSVRTSTMTTSAYYVPSRSTATLDNWTPVTTDELEKLIGSAPCKTCQWDSVPTWLVKNMNTLLSPFVTLLFNKSLRCIMEKRHGKRHLWPAIVFHPTLRKPWFAHC